MTRLFCVLCLMVCLAVSVLCQAADSSQSHRNDGTPPASATPKLPDWQVLEFEQKAYWAVARSRLELRAVIEQSNVWQLDILNSVVENAEQMTVQFDPTNGRVTTLTRLSRGKDQRLKTYQYGDKFILRERRESGPDPAAPADQWPIANSKKVPYPTAQADAVTHAKADTSNTQPPVVTSPYILLLLAQRLAQGENQSQDVLVHTDLNFYRVHLSSGNGVPVDVDYKKNGSEQVRGKRETSAVALHVTPVGTLQEEPDFSLFGLHGDIILLFDRNSGLPLQVRGTAPRIGDTAINVKAITLREPAQ